MKADRHHDRLGGGTARRGSGQPDDAPAARWRRGALATYYVALTVANLMLLSGVARVVLSGLAAATAVLLFAAATLGAVRRGFGRPGRAWEKLAYLPMIDAVAQVAVTGELHHTTTLLLTLVGVGGAVPDRRIAMRAALLGCVGWAAVVMLQHGLRTPELGFYGGQLLVAVVLGAILHEALRRRQRDLKSARDQLAVVLARFESLFQASPAGVAVADEHGMLVAVNPAFCDLVGQPASELVGASAHAYLTPDGEGPVAPEPGDGGHPASAAAGAGVAVDGGQESAAGRSMRFVRPDGSVRWVWLTVGRTGAPDRSDKRRWMLLHLHDVTDRHLAERALRESDRLLAAVSVASRRIRTRQDARGTIIEAVRELAEADSVTMLEPDGTDLVATGGVGVPVIGTRVPMDGTSMIAAVYRDGQPVFLADPGKDPRVSAALLRLVDASSMMWQPVIADDRVVALLVVSWQARISSVSDLRARAVALLADETALALEHEGLLGRLERMAYTDMLTGLSNRRAWQAGFAELLVAARTDGRPLTVAIADLDHFKRFNDTYGHLAGDELLIATASAFRAQLRSGDLIARWGGEEFVVALPDSTAQEAAAILDRLRESTPGTETCSIGYAVWDGAESCERLLGRADTALYAAKAAGRDTVRAADPTGCDTQPGPVGITAARR